MAETLSPTFVGMDFSEVAEICYTKLNLLLLAMEARKYEGGDIYINPQNKVINPNAIGQQTPHAVLLHWTTNEKRSCFYFRPLHYLLGGRVQASVVLLSQMPCQPSK